jgi:trimeric autotransporter adhesin
MKPLIKLKTTTLLVIPLLLACFALLSSVQAAPDPAPPPGANTRDGAGSMAHITTGQFNSAFGTNALNKLTTGNNNAAQGNSALFSNTSGSGNVAVGSLALRFNTTGDLNSALGYAALQNNNGHQNVAIGWKALGSNTSGASNVAVGMYALYKNTIGAANCAFGFQALYSNDSFSSDNNAFGSLALRNNTNGGFNNAFGSDALTSNNTGNCNNAFGNGALNGNESGSFNVAIGEVAGSQITGSGNICIGADVRGVFGENNTTRIGNIYASVATTRAVYVTSSNKIGTLASSRRFKDDIKPMDKASEAVLALKPVSFRYKQEVDPDRIPMFGLVAEDVEKVNPDLVSRDEEGKPYTVRYEAVNAMLLNEFLKEHRKNEEQGATIAELRKGMEVLGATVKEQAAQIQKVSAQLEVNKPAPQVVNNNQ